MTTTISRKATHHDRSIDSGAANPPVSSRDFVFGEIVSGLYEGRFAPGQRLIEADLTKSYGVSRSSVREAFARLAAERIITLNPHRGAQIRLLGRQEAIDILEMLEVLIGLSAHLAAKRIGGAGAKALFMSAFKGLMSFADRPDSFELVRARNTFYRTLIEIGGNKELAQVLPAMHVHLLRVQFRQFGSVGVRFADYESIGEAVVAGKARAAELAARRHVRRIATAIRALPEDAFGIT